MSAEGVLIFNDQGRILLSNPTATQLFGYEDNDLINVPIERIIPDVINSRPIVLSGETKKKEKGINRHGVEFPLEISVCQFRGGEEFFNVAFFCGMPEEKTIPLTIHKRTPVIFLILDKSINISLINEYGCELLGCELDLLKGLNWFKNFLPDDNLDNTMAVFEHALRSGVVENYESQLLTLRGDRHTIKWTIHVINDSSGKSVGTFCTGIDMGKIADGVIDIHHFESIKKLNEQLEARMKQQTRSLINSLATEEIINSNLQLQIQKRKATEEKLIKFQRLYDTMVHNFPDGVIGVLDRNFKYILIEGKELNEIDFPALGLTREGVSENPDPALAEITLAKIKEAFKGKSISFEVKIKDRHYNISAVPMPDEHNNINEILCVLKNVTERKRMEDGLLKALEKEKELGELKSRFVTMASHEFKTPLATILSSAFLLENYSGEDYAKEKMVHTNRIRRSVNNLTMILNEILSLEKLEENQLKVVNSNINIPSYLNELISEVEPVKKEMQVVNYHHLGKEEMAFLDPNLLWSVVTNLVSNAFKYSFPGDHIDITSEIKNEQIILTVSDHGIGIPADEHSNIFGRFYRARNATNFEGTGLGLHIVEKNVTLFKGNISFTSELNKGTKFTVILPNGKSITKKNSRLIKNSV